MKESLRFLILICLITLCASFAAWSRAAEENEEANVVIPHAQSEPPGPPVSPREAIEKMTVPEGFHVELVASEPDIVNPVAMTFDERGRIWITESLEYPRSSAGPGRDRIKVLEDTDRDGVADRFTVFAEGLNIPSGIAVGYGGVWVANSPDILFMRDVDGDGKADTSEVVVTGFGRSDTHELPNSLTWGPDGWLYGLNGVFNHSHVKHKGREYRFTCALFRIHPRTHDFELFAEGTSNPWGVAWDPEGSAFVSACVIDHLWHLTETGYYHRQGGPYPPFTWKIGSIVDHTHQKAAYCGLHYFDSDAYPAEYRDRLYMGNIHGGCINVDELERDGSTYFARGKPDFLNAHDVWFMPVVQKTGPDGCLYILDWYDRYHCYQDARRDPRGIDRGRGRLYRVRYGNTPRAPKFDLARESDEQLIERLGSPNIYFREMAQRLLQERNASEARSQLEHVVLDPGTPKKTRMHALFALVGTGSLDTDFHMHLLTHEDASFRAWGVRAAGNFGHVKAAVRAKISEMSHDPSPDVKLQVAIAARKVAGLQPQRILSEVIAVAGDDKLIPHIVWQNLLPFLDDGAAEFLASIQRANLNESPGLARLMPHLIDRMIRDEGTDPGDLAKLFNTFSAGSGQNTDLARRVLAGLASSVQTGQIQGEQLEAVRAVLGGPLSRILAAGADNPMFFDAARLAAAWHDPVAVDIVRGLLRSKRQTTERRRQALDALVASRDAEVLDDVDQLLGNLQDNSLSFRVAVLASLGRLDEAAVADVVLRHYDAMEPELKPRAIELLTGRSEWSKTLLRHIGSGKIPASALNVNQVRKLLNSRDGDLVKAVQEKWGTLRDERSPEREKVIAEMRSFIRGELGDARNGIVVFNKVCGQCHKIYGEGQDVGPEITSNGRATFEQLLSNVFDPSLVIGASYQAETVITADGRVLTGLLVEDSPDRVVLKVEGGKLETIPRDNIDEMRRSKLSMMPEKLEEQVTRHELADLFAFLTLDRRPNDPAARRLPGTFDFEPIETRDPRRFDEVVGEVLWGFTTQAVGDGGVALLPEHLGHAVVLRTHPVSRRQPCVLRRTVDIPPGRKTALVLAVGHHPQGDWLLRVKANGKLLHESVVGPETAVDGWKNVSVDLTPLAGQRVELELENAANGWADEYGFWGHARLLSD